MMMDPDIKKYLWKKTILQEDKGDVFCGLRKRRLQGKEHNIKMMRIIW